MKLNFNIKNNELIKNNIIENQKGMFIILSGISIIEIIMIIRALIVFDFAYPKHLAYFISYILLLVLSLIGFAIILVLRKNKSEKIINLAYYFSNIYTIFICTWACFISYYDMKDGNYPIVFLTVFISLPSFCLLRPMFYSAIIIIGTALMCIVPPLTLDRTFEQGYYINMTIYAIIAILLVYKLFALTKENSIARNKLLVQSYTDELTQVKNRRALDKYIRENVLTDHENRPIIILCDIDCFKMINDTYGHTVGDSCLKILSEELIQEFGYDSIFRFGGDEFIIFSKNSIDETVKSLVKINEILLEKIKDQKIQISSGIYQIKEDDNELNFFTKVDEALYKTKNENKGQYTIID